MVAFLHSLVASFSILHYRYDDDFVDRLSYFYTSSILIMMSIVVSFKQFGGSPLECWLPAHFTPSWEAYAEMYCWAQNTYFVPFSDSLPIENNQRHVREISYYQWVPFFLLIQAFMFYCPCLTWRLLNSLSGLCIVCFTTWREHLSATRIQMHDIISQFREKENLDPAVKSRTVLCIARHLEQALHYQHAMTNMDSRYMHRFLRCFNIRYYESYVTWLYMLVKLMYTGNVLLSLLLINIFLQTDEYGIYGFGVLLDLLAHREWKDSGNFPRVTHCDFEIRVLANVQRHTVQCVLVINIFTEKIFILLWLWYSALSVISILDTMYWWSISVRPSDRLRYVRRHMELAETATELDDPEESMKISHFVREFIKVDGVLVLRMINMHAGSLCCTELTVALWYLYLELSDKDSTAITPGVHEQVQTIDYDSEQPKKVTLQRRPEHYIPEQHHSYQALQESELQHLAAPQPQWHEPMQRLGGRGVVFGKSSVQPATAPVVTTASARTDTTKADSPFELAEFVEEPRTPRSRTDGDRGGSIGVHSENESEAHRDGRTVSRESLTSDPPHYDHGLTAPIAAFMNPATAAATARLRPSRLERHGFGGDGDSMVDSVFSHSSPQHHLQQQHQQRNFAIQQIASSALPQHQPLMSRLSQGIPAHHMEQKQQHEHKTSLSGHFSQYLTGPATSSSIGDINTRVQQFRVRRKLSIRGYPGQRRQQQQQQQQQL